MKNIFYLLLILLVSANAVSQNSVLSIYNLDGSDEVLKFNLTNVNDGADGLNNYVIERLKDSNSKEIEKAVNSGRVFESVYLKIVFSNGDITTSRLDDASLSNYSTFKSNGRKKSERFTLRYASKEMMQ